MRYRSLALNPRQFLTQLHCALNKCQKCKLCLSISLFHRTWEWIQMDEGEKGETDSVLNTEGQTHEWHLKSLCVCWPSFSSIARYSVESVFWSVDVIDRNQVKADFRGKRLPWSLPDVFCHGTVPNLVPRDYNTWKKLSFDIYAKYVILNLQYLLSAYSSSTVILFSANDLN